MADIVLTLTFLAFCAVAFLYVLACDRIIGPDPEGLDRSGARRERAPETASR